MSAKNVRNVSIFHISSCQTTCQGKNPNKLNNNFLIKLNYYFRFIFIWFFGRQIAFEHWAFKTRVFIGWLAKSLQWIGLFRKSPISEKVGFSITSENFETRTRISKLSRTTPTYSYEIMRSLCYQWRHQYGLDGMHE